MKIRSYVGRGVEQYFVEKYPLSNSRPRDPCGWLGCPLDEAHLAPWHAHPGGKLIEALRR